MLTLLRILPTQKKRGLTAHNRKVSAIVLDNGVEYFVLSLDWIQIRAVSSVYAVFPIEMI